MFQHTDGTTKRQSRLKPAEACLRSAGYNVCPTIHDIGQTI